jgi:hypothetical protein
MPYDPAIYARPEYVASQKKRKWSERFFGWLKNTAPLRKTRRRGHPKLDWNIALSAANGCKIDGLLEISTERFKKLMKTDDQSDGIAS